MPVPNVKELIKAGFHFGHRTSRWNPAMKPYIFKRRNLIHIIDLRSTLRGMITGRELAKAVASRGQYVLFVGTKKQAKDIVQREADQCGMPYVAERWPGGLLTNYVTIRQRLDRLEELEHMERTGQMELHSKKMISSLRREKKRILRNLGGVRDMDGLPGLLVIVDPAREHLAVREAIKLDIPVVGLVDTNGNPDELDVVVPGNDDSISAIDIFVRAVAEGVKQGKSMRRGPRSEQQEETEQEVSEPVDKAEAQPVTKSGHGHPEQTEQTAESDVTEEPAVTEAETEPEMAEEKKGYAEEQQQELATEPETEAKADEEASAVEPTETEPTDTEATDEEAASDEEESE
jgi:small subunit ribosomal protein S2